MLKQQKIFFDGIKKLPAEHLGMKKELLLQWMAESQFLEKANVRLNDAAMLGEVKDFADDAFFLQLIYHPSRFSSKNRISF